jgi:D-alanyl-D-alanine carboxypeptidase/D-alanyl-D-alanine-endopeptidase (penicillin-binding protein 4)
MGKNNFIVLLVLLIWLPSSGRAENKYDQLFERILKSHNLSKEHAGWIVYNLDQKQAVSSWRAETAFIPASLTKLVTASALLNLLPKDLKFKTELHLKGASATQYKGDLYLKGGGDPSFTSEGMWVLVNHFVREGVQKIDGNIVVDESRFKDEIFSTTRQEERVRRAYDAPVSAASFNWNSVNIYARPGHKVGDPVQIFVDPASSYLQLKVSATTSKKGQADKLQFDFQKSETGSVETLTVRGSFPVGQTEKVYYRSIQYPALWAGYQLKEFLAQRGITVTGDVKVGKVPSGARVVASHEGKPLPLLIYDMQKWSNNYVAEMLIKNLSAELGGRTGTLADGMQRVQKYLTTLDGWKPGTFNYVNPSGLTRDNTMSPAQINTILKASRSDFANFAEFVFALPIAGLDGTLKNRMVEHKSRVRAKTGMLNGVVGLAGFVDGPANEVLSFAFIYNGPSSYPKVWSAFDSMAGQLSR